MLAWTVRSPEQAERALRFVDNYIFEGFVPAAASGQRPRKRGGRFSVNAAAASRASAVCASRP